MLALWSLWHASKCHMLFHKGLLEGRSAEQVMALHGTVDWRSLARHSFTWCSRKAQPCIWHMALHDTEGKVLRVT